MTVTDLAVRVAACISLAVVCSSPSFAQDGEITIPGEYAKRIQGQGEIAPLEKDIFGEQMSLYTGAVEFVQNDIDIPGNNSLSVAVSRRFTVNQVFATPKGHFGDWELDIPYLYGVFGTQGWNSIEGGACTNFAKPQDQHAQGSPDGLFSAIEYWHGNFLHLPGQGDSEMLKRSASAPYPSDGNTYPVNTKDGVVFRCIGADNLETGQFFEAHLKDGTRIRFNKNVARKMQAVTKGSPLPELRADGGAGTESTDGYFINRYLVWIVPTLITDRFGNTVTYNWTGNQLTSIEASDGRKLYFTYFTGTDRINTIADANPITSTTRVWSYSYGANGHLTSASRPDGRSWTFDLESIRYMQDYVEGSCGNVWSGYGPLSGTMTHPDGAKGSFTIEPVVNGRSNVNAYCVDDINGHDRYPAYFVTPALKSKTYSDATNPTGPLSLTWQYEYGPHNACYKANVWNIGPVCTTGFANTRTIKITDPTLAVTRYTFGNEFQKTEGQLLSVEEGLGSTTPRTTSHVYATPNSTAWPTGTSPRGVTDTFIATTHTPKQATSINLVSSGLTTTYTNTINIFETSFPLPRPTQITHSNSFGSSRTDTLSYHDDFGKYVLSQIKTRTTGGVTELSVTYGATSLKPEIVSAFGLVRQRAAYNTDGTLQKIWDITNLADAANTTRTTTFEDWMRGIPRKILFPGQPNPKRAEVSNEGWITGSIDERYSSATSAPAHDDFQFRYAYDKNGRLTSETYPSEDTVAWANRDITYTYLTASESGVPAGSLRATSIVGQHEVSTYYDAVLRPILIADKDKTTNTVRFTRKTYSPSLRRSFTSYPSTSFSEPAGFIITTDALGRQFERYTTTDGVTPATRLETITYGQNNTRSVKDGNGNITTTTYQAFGEPSYERVTLIVAPQSQTTSISRDVFGKMTSATQSGGGVSVTRTYLYDTYQRPCGQVDPESALTVRGFDDASQVVWEASGQPGSACVTIAPSEATHFEYHPRGNKKKDRYPSGLDDVTYGYDAALNLTSISNPKTNLTKVYNKRNLLEEETLVVPGDFLSFKLDYRFNAEARIDQLTYPDGRVVPFMPNAYGEALRVDTFAVGATYHPTGMLAGFNYGVTGTPLSYSLSMDARRRPLELKILSGTTKRIDLFHDLYDDNDNLQHITDAADGSETKTLGYDGLNRLTSATGVWGDWSYSYDALNNVSSRGGSNSQTFTYLSNRLNTVNGGAARTYHPKGQLWNDGTRTFTWTEADRVKSISGIASYEYTGSGMRYKTTKQNGEIEYSIYSTGGQMLYSYKPANKEFTDYLYLGSMPIAEVRTIPDPQGGPLQGAYQTVINSVSITTPPELAPLTQNPTVVVALNTVWGLPPQYLAAGDQALTGNAQTGTATTTYLHTDLLHSPLQGSGSTGNQLWQEHYDPYGQKLNGIAEKLGYTGHVFDAESNLTYAQARHYDQQLGRFISTDPLQFDGSNPFAFNRYAYANNNPYRFMDPTGLSPEDGLDPNPPTSDPKPPPPPPPRSRVPSSDRCEFPCSVIYSSGEQGNESDTGMGDLARVAVQMQNSDGEGAAAFAQQLASQGVPGEEVTQLIAKTVTTTVQVVATVGSGATVPAVSASGVRNTFAGVLMGAATLGGAGKGLQAASAPIRAVIQVVEQRKRIEKATQLVRAASKATKNDLPR